jgi:hypothetical protein
VEILEKRVASLEEKVNKTRMFIVELPLKKVRKPKSK